MFIDREDYLAHITDINQVVNMKRLLDKIEICLRDYSIEATDFFNPYEIKLAESILNRFTDIKYIIIGGLDNAERKIIVIAPDYHFFTREDYPLTYYKLRGAENKNHRDILGALMSLGVIREKIGDILVSGDTGQIVVKKEISSYFLYNLDKVGRDYINIEEIDLDDLEDVETVYREKTNTVASLRLDAIISMVYNISRSDSQRLINADKVKVNWEPINKISLEISEGDLVSIRGFGRFILDSIEGLSRKNRIRITTKILI